VVRIHIPLQVIHLSDKISQYWPDLAVLIEYLPANPEPGQRLMLDLGTYHLLLLRFRQNLPQTGRRSGHVVEHVTIDHLYWSGEEMKNTNCKLSLIL